MLISIVTSLYKSSPYIRELHERLTLVASRLATDYEIIFVNDASPDDGLSIAVEIASRDPHVVVIDLSRNFGQHKAIMRGIAEAKGDRIFVMDSDLEEEPEWLERVFCELDPLKTDVVYGVQQAKKRNSYYRIGRSVFYFVLNRLSDYHFPENVVTARLMTRRYVDALLLFQEREVFLAGVWHVAGFGQMPVLVEKIERSPTTYTLGRLVALFLNSVTSFSTKPLMAVFLSGIILSLLAFIYTGVIVYRKLVWGMSVEGWASVMAATLTIGGITLMFNGIVAIYVAKIFLEVKQRPRTIVKSVYRPSVASVTPVAENTPVSIEK